MNNVKYNELVNSKLPKEDRLLNSFVAFFIGGTMGIIGELLLIMYSHLLDLPKKECGTYMIITIIFIACVFTCLGFFDKWVNFAKAGLFIPITGFAHAMMSTAMEFRREGIVTGIGANMFKLTGSVIVLGVVSAYLFGMIRLILFGG